MQGQYEVRSCSYPEPDEQLLQHQWLQDLDAALARLQKGHPQQNSDCECQNTGKQHSCSRVRQQESAMRLQR